MMLVQMAGLHKRAVRPRPLRVPMPSMSSLHFPALVPLLLLEAGWLAGSPPFSPQNTPLCNHRTEFEGFDEDETVRVGGRRGRMCVLFGAWT